MAIRSMLACGFVGVAALVTACTASTEDSVAQPDTSTLDPQAKLGTTTGGTWLTAGAATYEVSCNNDGTGDVTFSGTLSSTAARAPDDVTVDGVFVDEVAPQDFIGNGAKKTYSYSNSYETTYSNGSHDVQLCFTQPSGNLRMTACTTVKVVVACTPETVKECHDRIFGETIGNKNLCKANGNGGPHVNIQASGDYGSTATITIDGPGYHAEKLTDRRGESCNYIYDWDPKAEGAVAGDYTFKISGSGSSAPQSWVEHLFCSYIY